MVMVMVMHGEWNDPKCPCCGVELSTEDHQKVNAYILVAKPGALNLNEQRFEASCGHSLAVIVDRVSTNTNVRLECWPSA